VCIVAKAYSDDPRDIGHNQEGEGHRNQNDQAPVEIMNGNQESDNARSQRELHEAVVKVMNDSKPIAANLLILSKQMKDQERREPAEVEIVESAVCHKLAEMAPQQLRAIAKISFNIQSRSTIYE
jgi:methylthioribose-1-phosphate isomerase